MKTTQRFSIGILVGLLGIPSSPAFGRPSEPQNVVLLMVDGVRWQEVFGGVDTTIADFAPAPLIEPGVELMPYLKHSLKTGGVVFGNATNDEEMLVSNRRNVSLPGYQSIMTGFEQPCNGNNCGRVTVETVGERLVRELKLDRFAVASIASWDHMPLAVEHIPGQLLTNAKFDLLTDGSDDAIFDLNNQLQAADLAPWSFEARWDRYTMAHSLHYLKKHKPRFLFISLNDTDNWAHANRYAEYINAIQQIDAWISELQQTLDAMGEYGRNTTLIITTDHGRGNGGSWKDHGPDIRGAERVWLYARGPGNSTSPSPGRKGVSHKDIRPTIEAILGLVPFECATCGSPIPEIVGQRQL